LDVGRPNIEPINIMINKFFKTIYYVLIAGIIAIAILLVASMFPIPGNYQVKIVLSGSMEPAIHTGSVAVIKPLSNYKVGDIVTFGKDTKTDVPTTHRIVNSRAVSGEMRYQTKGDANGDPDGREIRENEIIGKVLFSIPYLGYMVDFAKKPIGFITLIAIPATIIIFDEMKKIWMEIRRMRKEKKNNLQL